MTDTDHVETRMLPWLMRTRLRILLVVLVTTAIPLGLMTLLVLRDLNRAATMRAFTRGQALAGLAAHTIRERIDGLVRYAGFFALAPELSRGLEPAAAAAARPQLETLVRGNPLIQRAFLADAAATLLVDFPPVPATVGRRFDDRDWYQGALRTRRPYVSAFYERTAEPRVTVTAIAFPVAGTNGQSGYLVVQHPVEALVAWLDTIRPTPGTRVWLADQNGLIAQAPPPPGGSRDAPLHLPPFVIARHGQAGSEEGSLPFLPGERGVTSYAPVPDSGWTVLVCQPASDILAPLHSVRLSMPITVVATVIVILLGAVCSLAHARRHVLQRLAVEQERDRFFKMSMDMLCEAGTDGYFKRVNPAFTHILGWSEQELLQVPYLEFVHPDDRHATIREACNLESGRITLSFENRYRCRDGSYRWLSWTSTPSGNRIYAGARDISRERALADSLREAKDAAEEATRAKSEFLASMSHELRTPLNAIIGFSQVLREQYFGPLNPRQLEYVADILDSGRHLLSLIDDILDLAKIEAGRARLELSRVCVPELFAETISMVRERMREHDLHLKLEIAEDVRNLVILADRRRLKQVLFNLLSNAVKFTPDGGTITLQAARLSEAELLLTVRDTGVGISADDLQKLFTRFFQGRRTTPTATVAGTGLGLALCRELVSMHGGRIWADSAGEDKGSAFSFTLRVKGPPSEEGPTP